ncbi:imidazoleglycerol-phosphate dehydratase [Oscillatoriales cyanobacterium USR001]|nr:imidazoleglycerol-phosphate dehydratase [Oscillatoriales cyanobacterium USR001]
MSNIKFIVVFDVDGVLRDVGGSYRRAIADTVEHFTSQAYRPTSSDIDVLKSEGLWNNDWDATIELVYRYFETQNQSRSQVNLDPETLINFFQSRYRGPNPENWTGYICSEPTLVSSAYLESLTQNAIAWGFFSGAMHDEVMYLLKGKLGLTSPVLVAMEDAPGKPNPAGLFAVIEELERRQGIDPNTPVIYVGDTVADLYTVENARKLQPSRVWGGVGILPPHVQETQSRRDSYTQNLLNAGAAVVFSNVKELTPTEVEKIAIANS